MSRCVDEQPQCSLPRPLHASFTLTVVVEEDQMRSIWPSCPANGWKTGVHRLTSQPNGFPLHMTGTCHPPETTAATYRRAICVVAGHMQDHLVAW
eukprot:gene19501-biopygen17562